MNNEILSNFKVGGNKIIYSNVFLMDVNDVLITCQFLQDRKLEISFSFDESIEGSKASGRSSGSRTYSINLINTCVNSTMNVFNLDKFFVRNDTSVFSMRLVVEKKKKSRQITLTIIEREQVEVGDEPND